jgi:colicin import membrane protein
MKAGNLDDLRPRPPDRLTRGAMLAILAHLGLLVALSLGVNWKTSEPEGVEAELWAAVPQVAAPRAMEPEPKPKPAPPPEPPKPTPKTETPPPPPPDRDAEIAREKRDQKEKLERQRLEEERQRAEQEKRERERERAQREAEEAKREAQDKKEEAERKKVELEKQKKAEAERLAKIEAQRAENLKRIQGEANATGAPGSTGTAAQSAGPSAGYAGRIKARIKPNIVFTDDLPGNPIAAVEVKVAPDGTIIGRRLVTSSGVASWDEAVLRAIDRTAVLPRNPDGPTPPSMLIEFRPRDL